MAESEKTRKIISESIKLFRYGIRSVSMDDIARELGMSKKTLYEYFDNKSSLLSAILRTTVDDFSEWYENLKLQDLNAIDELLQISKRVNDEFAKFSPSNNYDLKKYYPEVIKEHITHEKKLTYTILVENLKKGIAGNIYRNDLDIELIAELYIQKMVALHTSDDFWFDAGITFEKIFETMFENHIRGIVNPVGLKYFEQRKSQLKLDN